MRKYNTKEQQERFLAKHKPFKVYLDIEKDMDIIRLLMQVPCASKTIRQALRYYVDHKDNEGDAT